MSVATKEQALEKARLREARRAERERLAAEHDARFDHLSERERRLAKGPNWPVVFWLGLLHVGALAAPWTFTWYGLGMMAFMHWLNGSIGICLGYHRLFTHRSFQTYTPIRFMLAVAGSLAGEGGVVYWTANHRQHHAHSDMDNDPHSPEHGTLWGHMFWTMYGLKGNDYTKYIKHWAPDLARDKMLMFVDRTFLFWQFLSGFIIAGVGYALGGWSMAVSFLVWGVFLRLVAILHTTWFVNSASHIWGYRNYETTDNSRNLWWVALIAYGEGWHNNHHAYPAMARAGHKWWEYDPTFWVLKLMEATGLAWNIVDGHHHKQHQLPENHEVGSDASATQAA